MCSVVSCLNWYQLVSKLVLILSGDVGRVLSQTGIKTPPYTGVLIPETNADLDPVDKSIFLEWLSQVMGWGFDTKSAASVGVRECNP